MGLEDIDQALVLGAILIYGLELVAARTEGPTRSVAKGSDRGFRFLRGVDQLFTKCTEDAIAAGVDLADAIGMGARSFDHSAGRCVDDGGNAPGLSVEGVARARLGGHR